MDLNPKARETKAKVNKWNYIKLKASATYQNEETTYGTEEIFTNHISNKGLIYKYIKNTYK